MVRRTFVFLCALSIIAAIPVLAADDPVSGAWSGNASSSQGGAPIKLLLKVDGGTVTGQITTDQGTEDIKDGTWKDAVLTFRATYNGVPVVLKGSVKDGKLAGDFSYNEGEMTGTWEAARVTP